MTLEKLLEKLDCQVIGEDTVTIKGMSYDSRKIEQGFLFFAIKGFETDGHQYIAMAIEKGAVAVVVEQEQLGLAVPQIVVADSRKAMALMAAAYYDYPAEKLCMLGVTGTSGKTSVTYMLKSILEQAGRKVGLLGTISNIIGDEVTHATHTTPESLDLHRLLAHMLEQGMDTVVMEVSSHSLSLDRVYGIAFTGAIFTNLSQDHLDFHGDFLHYRNAKALLFAHAENAAINMDDEYAIYMLGSTKGYAQTFGIERKADVMAHHIDISLAGTRFVLDTKGTQLPILMKTPGLFTVYNALSAITLSLMLGIDMMHIKNGLETTEIVAGRFEMLDTDGEAYAILLDYAHKPDGLEKVLSTAKDFTENNLVCIFGCGGNRDKEKRPIMGAIAERIADYVVVTSDNPRFEEPMVIIEDILVGMERENHTVIEDRRAAIKYAMQHAAPGDVIVLAGKGHEDYQEIKGIKYPFDEKVVVAELLVEIAQEKEIK